MKVKKYIEIPEEILFALAEGRYVEGSLHRDKGNRRIVFNVYNRKPGKRQPDRMICVLENGWLKESPKRIKFYNSVKKEVGVRLVNVVMHRELNTAMDRLEVEEIINRV